MSLFSKVSGMFFPSRLKNLIDVITSSVDNNDVLQYDSLTDTWIGNPVSGGAGTDEKVKVSANDTTNQYLDQKLQAGNNVHITTQNAGANEKLRIRADNDHVRVSSGDTTPSHLSDKVQAGAGISFNTLNPSANEKLEVSADVESVNGQTGIVNLTAADVGAAPTAHTHDAADIVSGTISTNRLASGVANSTSYLRGDQQWVTISAVDERAKVSLTDTTTGYLNAKILAGQNIQVSQQNVGSNESLLVSLWIPSGTTPPVGGVDGDLYIQYT